MIGTCCLKSESSIAHGQIFVNDHIYLQASSLIYFSVYFYIYFLFKFLLFGVFKIGPHSLQTHARRFVLDMLLLWFHVFFLFVRFFFCTVTIWFAPCEWTFRTTQGTTYHLLANRENNISNTKVNWINRHELNKFEKSQCICHS